MPYHRCEAVQDGHRCVRLLTAGVDNGGHRMVHQNTRLGLPLPEHVTAAGHTWVNNTKERQK